MDIRALIHTCKLGEDDHPGPGGVNGSFLVQELGSGPGIVDPYCGVAADPEGNYRAVERFGQLLEVDPWLVPWEEVGVAYDGERQWTWRLNMSECDSSGVDEMLDWTYHLPVKPKHSYIVDD